MEETSTFEPIPEGKPMELPAKPVLFPMVREDSASGCSDSSVMHSVTVVNEPDQFSLQIK